ncbi:hypothetical protein QBC32DRAFT_367761 [Pseudoneurospora amorphoporcata]|uniref:Uncharacterized protein n=1 Tax=Pseudoneurospora amorphoporcata TaxID=241081 RepID=A0AAN6P4D3_9PEZI|nr:hypothetical protein QBC32DRAFT_367761 [Pseudoneurospora amorphoporcata]
MPASHQASKPLLFRLPLEIRLMIYRHAWKVNPEIYTIPGTGQLESCYVKQQLPAIGKLGAICQQIKTEAFDEYFHHAQACLRWEFNDPSSPLLLTHLRHASFYWHGDVFFDWSDVSTTEAFCWLQILKQLRTLEVVVTGGSGWGWFGDYQSKQMSTLLENLRGLEKVTIKFDLSDLSQSDAERCMEALNVNAWFLKFKRKIESFVTLPEGATPPCQVIKERIGCLKPR